MIEGNYLFEWLNNGLEITDPTLIIDSDGIAIYPSKMTINVPIFLEKDGVKFGMSLKDVIVEDFNYDADQLRERVITRLQDYLVV